MARIRSHRTAVCVLRIEARGDAGVLITLTTTPDVTTTTPAQVRAVGTIEDALSLVAGFLREYSDVSDQE